MFWWISGSICLGLFLLVLLLGIILMIVEGRRERYIRENGIPLIGWLVQANTDLFKEGSSDLPAQFLVSFPGERTATVEQLESIAGKLSRLKSEDPRDRVEGRVADLVTDETYRPSNRVLLPREFTDDPRVHSVHVMVRRAYLPEKQLTLPYIHCAAIPGEEGYVCMLPYPDDDEAN